MKLLKKMTSLKKLQRLTAVRNNFKIYILCIFLSEKSEDRRLEEHQFRSIIPLNSLSGEPSVHIRVVYTYMSRIYEDDM